MPTVNSAHRRFRRVAGVRTPDNDHNTPLVQRVADLADREAVTTAYIVSNANYLRRLGITADQVEPDLARRAARLNRIAMRQLLRRHGVQTTHEAKPSTDITRDSIFNFPVDSIVVWMGADLWDFEEAYTVLDRFNVDLSDAQVMRLLKAGRAGTRTPAPLCRGQAQSLYEILEKYRKHNRK